MILLAALMAASMPAADEAAIFHAAGFTRTGAHWRGSCGDSARSYRPASIGTYRDINGDGKPDAIVNEGSHACYGEQGSRFWLLSKDAKGAWRLMFTKTGTPEFVPNTRSRGWPFLTVTGPGLCFPVYQWNGRGFTIRTFEHNGVRCKGPH